MTLTKLKEIRWRELTPYKNWSFRDYSANEKFVEIIVLNTKETTVSKINVSFILHFSMVNISAYINESWYFMNTARIFNAVIKYHQFCVAARIESPFLS